MPHLIALVSLLLVLAVPGLPSSATAAEWTIIGTGDFNGDGTTDVLWQNTHGDIFVWLMQQQQVMAAVYLGTADEEWTVAGIGDFNGDGIDDVLWNYEGRNVLYLWLMSPAGMVASPPFIGGVWEGPDDWAVVGVGDLDGDGKADILWRHLPSGGVYYWRMDGATIVGFGLVSTAE